VATEGGGGEWTRIINTSLGWGQRFLTSLKRGQTDCYPAQIGSSSCPALLGLIKSLWLQAALDRARSGRTTIVVAHRLSTVIGADVIVALERGGRVAEVGTHADLMARRGLYYRSIEIVE